MRRIYILLFLLFFSQAYAVDTGYLNIDAGSNDGETYFKAEGTLGWKHKTTGIQTTIEAVYQDYLRSISGSIGILHIGKTFDYGIFFDNTYLDDYNSNFSQVRPVVRYTGKKLRITGEYGIGLSDKSLYNAEATAEDFLKCRIDYLISANLNAFGEIAWINNLNEIYSIGLEYLLKQYILQGKYTYISDTDDSQISVGIKKYFGKRKKRLLRNWLFPVTFPIVNIKETKYSPLSVYITGNPLHGCPPLKVAFKSIVSGGKTPYTYEWHLGILNSNDENPVVTYKQKNKRYQVYLTVKDALGNTETSNILIISTKCSKKTVDKPTNTKSEPQPETPAPNHSPVVSNVNFEQTGYDPFLGIIEGKLSWNVYDQDGDTVTVSVTSNYDPDVDYDYEGHPTTVNTSAYPNNTVGMYVITDIHTNHGGGSGGMPLLYFLIAGSSGETITVTFTITATDEHGASSSATISQNFTL